MAPSRNRRPGFSRRAQYGLFLSYVIAGAGALVALVLLALSSVNPPAYAAARATVAELTTPLSSGLAAIGRGLGSIPAGIGEHFAVKARNAELRRELADASRLLQRARTLNYDNRRLRALLHFRERAVQPVVTARLVSSTASSTRRVAVLNAGSWQGVREGQPVQGPEGLIGRILETGPNTARVLLITDPESIVPVRRTRDGLAALVVGRGDGMLDVRSVSLANAAFGAGDLFVTSGTGGIFAPNIPVARVVRRASDIALARALAQPNTLDFALVQQAFLPPPAPKPAPTATPTAMPSPSPTSAPTLAPSAPE
ncbi:rod shape-determining protein MreC [Sphingomonas qilianensis]|uniref:Cell shape-determining protein MreC n=1 Tax=Sphingomonas qilianensis TaxID=1736690 RepID=A0ABU9XLW7_9SPHN